MVYKGRNFFQLLKKVLISVFLLFIMVENLSSQALSWDEFVERLTTGEDSEYASWEFLYEELADRHENPFNLQTITREQLETLPFLSTQQIENILAYVHDYAPLESIYELQLIEEIDYETRALLYLFVYVGDVDNVGRSPLKWKNLLHYGKHEAIFRTDIPFYYRKGYYQYPSEILTRYPNRKYLGDRFYHSVRYQYTYSDRLAMGIVAENDAGEPFFNKGNLGYDFYSYYLILHDVGRLHTLALGNYRLSFGQGLVLNTQFGMGKQYILNSIYSTNKGIKKHASTNESDYFRGIAATYRFGKFDISGFYSFREMDATVDNEFITSLKTDGYHRTMLEMSKKNNVYNHLIGSNLTFSTPFMHLGLTGVYTVFNKSLKPVREYQKYNPQGNHFTTVGMNYRLDYSRISFIGETAISGNGGVATLNAVAYRFSQAFRMLLLQRYYSKDYEGIYAHSFEEGGQVRNENGIYLGSEALLGDRLRLTTYFDCFEFPYMKYRASFDHSCGWEGFMQLSSSKSITWDWFVRYRYKTKGRDFKKEDTNHNGIAPFNMHSLKAQIRWKMRPQYMLKTTIDGVKTSFYTSGNEQGYQLSQSFVYTSNNSHLSLEIGEAYFHTDSYDTRVYSYERSLLYSFSYPSYYGRGMHTYLWGRYDINKMFTMLVKYVYIHYFDRNHIASGTQEIESNQKHDLYLQLRLRF